MYPCRRSSVHAATAGKKNNDDDGMNTYARLLVGRSAERAVPFLPPLRVHPPPCAVAFANKKLVKALATKQKKETGKGATSF